MKQEVFSLIEQAARDMKLGLDFDDENVKKHVIANAPVEPDGAGPRIEKNEDDKTKRGA